MSIPTFDINFDFNFDFPKSSIEIKHQNYCFINFPYYERLDYGGYSFIYTSDEGFNKYHKEFSGFSKLLKETSVTDINFDEILNNKKIYFINRSKEKLQDLQSVDPKITIDEIKNAIIKEQTNKQTKQKENQMISFLCM